MIKLIARIGVVVFLTCVIAFGVMADGNYVYPPGAEPDEIEDDRIKQGLGQRAYNRISVPDRALKSAYDIYNGTYLKADPIVAVNKLRVFVLAKRLDKVRENLNWAIEQEWDEDFIDLLRRSIEWGDHIWHSDGAYVWAQSKIEEDRSPHESHKRVRFWIESVARGKKYAPAQYDYVQKRYLDSDTDSYSALLALGVLTDLGERNYEPAIQQLIEYFMTGVHWAKHTGAAYFWFKRGEGLGLDLSPWRPRIEQLVSEQDHAWAKLFRDLDEVPKPWDLK